MRSQDEQLSEILRRSDKIREKTALRNHMIMEAATSLVCLAFVILSVAKMPDAIAASDSSSTNYGSLILSSQNMGYVVVGVLAFILGVCITMLCIHWKKYKAHD